MDTDRPSVQSDAFTTRFSRRRALSHLAGGGVAAALLATMGRDIVQATPKPHGREGEEPNHFVLEDARTRIIYDVMTDAGQPGLSYQGPHGSHSFVGDKIRTEESALGCLVTGHLGAFPDQGDLWLTLLLPRFNPMNIEDDPIPFTTLAILKWLISTIAGPPREGALEEYRVVMLEGTAEFVMS